MKILSWQSIFVFSQTFQSSSPTGKACRRSQEARQEWRFVYIKKAMLEDNSVCKHC